MELKQVLEEIPDLTRRFVYYLEAKGYIRPEKIQKQRIARREYSGEDLKTIREVWRYYNRGYALQAAYELATATDRAVTYLAMAIPFRRHAEVLEGLKECPQVVEAAVVYGAELALLAKTDTPDQSEVYHSLVPVLTEMGITGLPDVHFVGQTYRAPQVSTAQREGKAMMAYVLMRVPGKDVGDVMGALKALTQVKEASTVYGESDIIVRIETEDQEELDDLVMRQLHDIPAVESTRTFLVVRDLHWSRS